MENPIAKQVQQAVETLGQSKERIMEPLVSVSSNRRAVEWNDNHLKMKVNHQQILTLLHSTLTFSLAIRSFTTKGYLLVIYGGNGCGKSHAARAIKRWFSGIRMSLGPMPCTNEEGEADCKIPDVIYRNWPSVVSGFKRDQWLVCDHLIGEYLTIIDDIGAEHDPSGIGLEKLYLILNRRERKYTLITTNYPPSEWEAKFERRIASRLFRNAVHVSLDNVPDFNA